MEFTSLTDLVMAVFDEIRDRNTRPVKDPVPLSSPFHHYLEKKFGIREEKVPELMAMLKNAKMIFGLNLAGSEQSSSGSLVGYVITRGDVIQQARKRAEEALEKLYTDEFHRKISSEKIITELRPKRDEYANTPLGITANMVSLLIHFQSLLERNILQYSDKIKEKLLAEELDKGGPVNSYLGIGAAPSQSRSAVPASAQKKAAAPAPEEIQKKSRDSAKYEDLRNHTGSDSPEKTLKLYGIEFYTRVCFRDYQFAHMQKLVEDGYISKSHDLKTVKVHLEKERMNSDKDLRLIDYAADINSLMKCLNEKLKKTTT